ncbi:methyltransferase domain-containing protein [Vagococcus fluvialis]|mgnify:CR=1 FL=1|uniref:methyltransferase domain-containing protein n=1 Tax=Vagococcus fluvialis TaxID=2738 RepID=UPI0014332066|nr:methyltransferase domain-containing protein [Vagococcus fluvialis]MBO0442490.1 methyltransferase domain-containing protein [Vagococcus fluvialis]MBO0479327.1 methyltransferase domain-containing protein [Vagococcus fluvialis]MBO0485185.1 methyltransferase domain-containing protein [Vagococcus fluvialis]MBO0487677.1 methyltransferase domain-containing protein [Vagococcus fluvialis]MDT2746387.1 methyltransferase domain-containing protein [Vagococcus fluvialis]
MLKKKIDYGREFLEAHLELFLCPKCQSKFKEVRGNTMICLSNHQYDLSKKGTIHFPNHHLTSDYDKEMLLSRRKMIQNGLYQKLEERLTSYIEEVGEELTVVDMGCGEGSFVNRLSQQLSDTTVWTGFDLSKDGVQLASDFSSDAFFFIGDVTQMPFQNESIDILLNIFSPSHYEEMSRVLKKTGLIIKVIPESGYLKEMREIFYQDNVEKQNYSNENVYEKFKKDVQLISEERVTYQFPVVHKDYEDILKMSPIHWGATSEAKEYAKEHPFKQLTIDVKILIGKKQ